ncbi:uncharacterized protein VTP21DRAFT_2450 [Calcarisporiella thermophila]|uniref:uncharacterized protein n=1 Tax=Calcarisporiella thermophila TaxID=911321 RepID=UPI00374365BE
MLLARLLKSRLTLKQRLERRRAILLFLKQWIPKLSFILFIIALFWILLFPYHRYSRGTYVSENALLPGQVNVYYGPSESVRASEYKRQLTEIIQKDSYSRASFVEDELRRAGLKTVVQNFTVSSKYGDLNAKTTFQMNAYGILRAPRGDGTEAIVLSAPWKSRDGRNNINGVAALLSISWLFRQYTFWAKDIILLVYDGENSGVQHWLEQYHGLSSDESPSLLRSGAIQAAVNLDFPESDDFGALGIFFEGVNGQQPNLDLINTVTRVCGNIAYGMPVMIHDIHANSYYNDPLGDYMASFKNLLYMMRYQALGRPTGGHGPFLRYRIDAITLYGIAKQSPHHPGYSFYTIGTIVESTFRSLNNLLERFHQSFFFYILLNTERFISIANYLPPAIMFACSMIFHSLLLWGRTGQGPMADDSHKDEAASDLQMPPPFSVRPRNLKPTFGVLFTTHIAGLLIFSVIRPNFAWFNALGLDNQFKLFLAKLIAVISIQLISLLASVKLLTNRPGMLHPPWLILKSIALAITGMVVSTLSAINFSLAVCMGILVTLPYTFIRPSSNIVLRLAQLAVLFAISPMGLLASGAWLTGRAPDEIMQELLGDYEDLGTWLLPFLCCVYLPLNTVFQAVAMAPLE